MFDRKLMEEIDACRPGSHDRHLPELSQLADQLEADADVRRTYQTVQRLDSRLTDAFGDVPLPAGLAARILDRLAKVEAGAAAVHPAGRAVEIAIAEPAAVSATDAQPQPATLSEPAHRHISRREWMRFGVTALVAITVATSAALLRPTAAPYYPELSFEAVAWFQQLADDWRPLGQVPRGFSVPDEIVVGPRGWQPLAPNIARGVVYDLSLGPRIRAALYVMRGSRPNLPAVPPSMPQSTTGGLAVSAWQTGGFTYVLVVKGDEHAYRKFLQTGHAPLA